MTASFVFVGDTFVGDVLSGKLVDSGFALASSIEAADYVFTYCLTQSQVEDVYLGSGGLFERAREGSCLIDLSPSTPTLAREVYAVARVNEMQALDAPLVLRDPCAHDAFGYAGNVMVLAGGEDEAYEAVLPLLRAFSDEVRPMGLAGMGQLAKAMTTLQQAPALVSLVEARALSRAQGAAAHEALAAAVSAGIVPAQAASVYRAMVEGHFHGTHTCKVLMAEVSAALAAAEDIGAVLPQAEACQQLLELFLVVGGADLPATALALAYADEEECADYGIDWARAEGMYEHEHVHEHQGHDEDFGYGFDSYDDEDDGLAGGFGGFSSN